MCMITTVTGEIENFNLGHCQCHEHIAISRGKSFEVNAALCIDNFENSQMELKRYKECGGEALVDAQPGGCNRMTEELHRLSRATEVKIIASTGFHRLLFYPDGHWIFKAEEKELENIFTNELLGGMYVDADTGFPQKQCEFKAGIIKTAYDAEGLSNRCRTLFKAAVNASLRAKRVLMVHIERGTDPVELLNFLVSEGMKEENIILCHMDRACDNMDVHMHILNRGVFLEYDTIGRFQYHSDLAEIELIKRIVSAGRERQLLYSLDTTKERLKSYNRNGVGLTYILEVFHNKLRQAGISEDTIHMFSVDNPGRALVYKT